MEWMDIAASIAAARHCRLPVVTANVDDLTFEAPIRLGDVVLIRARVNFTGRSSMEVGIRVDRELRADGKREHCLTGYFTFVALGADGKPTQVPPLELANDEDKRRSEDAVARREVRLNRRSKRVRPT